MIRLKFYYRGVNNMACDCQGPTNGAPICQKQTQALVVTGAIGLGFFFMLPKNVQNYIKITAAFITTISLLENYDEWIAEPVGNLCRYWFTETTQMANLAGKDGPGNNDSYDMP